MTVSTVVKVSVLFALVNATFKSPNISIAEVDALDKWQRGVLAVSVVANDAAYLDQQFQKIVELVESCGDLYIAASDVGVM